MTQWGQTPMSKKRLYKYRLSGCMKIFDDISLCPSLVIHDLVNNRIYTFVCFEQLFFQCLRHALRILKLIEKGKKYWKDDEIRVNATWFFGSPRFIVKKYDPFLVKISKPYQANELKAS